MRASVRHLAAADPDAARELVDHHFGPVWRRDFLGLPAVAAFVAPDDFFRPWLGPGRLFHHAFDLVGRADTLRSLCEAIGPEGSRVCLLPGRGGIGKTRVLLALARQLEEEHPDLAVRMLCKGVPVTPEGWMSSRTGLVWSRSMTPTGGMTSDRCWPWPVAGRT